MSTILYFSYLFKSSSYNIYSSRVPAQNLVLFFLLFLCLFVLQMKEQTQKYQKLFGYQKNIIPLLQRRFSLHFHRDSRLAEQISRPPASCPCPLKWCTAKSWTCQKEWRSSVSSLQQVCTSPRD